MSKIRAFIAIQLPTDVRKVLAEISENLAKQMPDRAVRWVKPDLMHITLRFLGNTSETSLPALYEALDRIGKKHQALEFKLDRLGCFPNFKQPRVIWAGLHGDVEAASRLKKELDYTIQDLGWPPEDKSFRAHITLGRVKDRRQLKDIDWNVNVEKTTLPVSEIHLVESKLTPQGPIYSTLHSSPLQSNK